jgi:hypothetical protein
MLHNVRKLLILGEENEEQSCTNRLLEVLEVYSYYFDSILSFLGDL